MNYKKYIFIFFISISSNIFPFCDCCRTTFVPRSQDDSTARLIRQNYVKNSDSSYSFYLMPSYAHSFRSKKIAEHFFGNNFLKFSGSRVENRGEKDILADYFGLPSDFESTVYFKPRIQNISLDFGFNVNLDWLLEGLSCLVSAPLVNTRWNMRMCEHKKTGGKNFHPAGYFSGGNLRLDRGQLPLNIKKVFCGGVTFGDMQDPLKFGKICCNKTKTGIASLKTSFMYNIIHKEDYSVDCLFFVGAPTGNKKTAEYLFEPVIGTNHCWEFGLGVKGIWEVWKDENETQACALFANINVSHLYSSWQKRSFDLKNGRGSRYMLISSFDKLYNDVLHVPQYNLPTLQYSGNLFHAINKTTFDCKVGVNIKANLLVGASYTYDSWRFDCGYNLWARSSEKLKCRQTLPSNKYALKGDAQLYGFFVVNVQTSGEIAVPLTVTQSKATIYSGQDINKNTDFTNDNCDNPVVAYERLNDDPLESLTADDSNDLGIYVGEIQSSNLPIFLSDKDIDNCSVLSRRLFSSSLSAHMRYRWKDRDEWVPYLGFGCNAEFSHSRGTDSEIMVWLEGGFLY